MRGARAGVTRRTASAKPGSSGEVSSSSTVSSSATSKVGVFGEERRKTMTSLAVVSTSHSSGRPARSYAAFFAPMS
jgi:hypothetical protein